MLHGETDERFARADLHRMRQAGRHERPNDRQVGSQLAQGQVVDIITYYNQVSNQVSVA